MLRIFFRVLVVFVALFSLSYKAYSDGAGALQGIVLPQGIQVPQGIQLPANMGNMNNINNGGFNSSNSNQSSQSKDSQDNSFKKANESANTQLIPNAFQMFIEQSTGQLLPIYGQNLFNETNAFSPADQVPVSNSYIIGPGDELVVNIFSSVLNINNNFTVSREGTITLPKIGPVEVAGKTFKDLEPFLKTRLQEVISDFSLSVSMGNLHGIDIYVVGQARKPGKYTISSVSTLINAIFTTGGPNSNGTMRTIQLIRGGQIVATLDLYQFLNTGKMVGDTHLLQGDTINFPKMGPEVALMGIVPTPAVYELIPSQSVKLRDVIAIAGGISTMTSPLKVSLERINADKDRPLSTQTLVLDDSGFNTQLKDGDILSFFPIKPAFENAVTLNIPDSPPLRLPIKSGWRIRDLIPNREALLTSGYYLRRFNLRGEKPGMTSGAGKSSGQGTNYGTSDGNSNPSFQTQQSSSTQGSNNTGMDKGQTDSSNNKNKLMLSGDNSQTSQISNNPDQQNFNINLDRIRLSNKLQINWSQAIIERTRKDDQKQIVLSFNLEKAIVDGDPTNNLLVEPGDIITILSQKDVQVPVKDQTRVVQLQGEVVSPGIYQLRPGETLTQLIERAGGLTHSAYIYGTELDRVSVRQLQQKNIESVIRELEDQITRQATTVNASSANMATIQQTVNTQAVPAIQAKINKLRSINPNGRVALNINPEAEVLPEVKLEDGDVINIPQTPSSITVLGAVYNENALIYENHKKASYYVNMAGLSENANKDQIFIARANGQVTVTHKSTWFTSDSVLDIPLMPGDAVVVPDKIYTEQGTFFRELTEYTQLFSQLGITAATLKFLGII